MSVFAKRMISLLCLLALGVHFFLVFIYASPLRSSSLKLRILSAYYMTPFFHQNWCLFVPAPSEDRRLYVRYFDDNTWSDWEDVFQKQISEQRNGVILANEEEVLGLSLSLVYLSNTEDKPQKVFLAEPDKFNFKVVKKAVRQYLVNHKELKNPQKFEILFSQIGRDYQANYYYKNLTFK